MGRYHTLQDVIDHKEEIIQKASEHPDYDEVYHLTFCSTKSHNPANICIAGSFALYNLLKILVDEAHVNVAIPIFQPNDVDLFSLNRPDKALIKYDKIDLIEREERDPEELILNFDLPCIRVALGLNFDLWVSLQALHAIFTGTNHIPRIITQKEEFLKLTRQYQISEARALSIHQRHTDRIQKYFDRGCKFKLIDSLKFTFLQQYQTNRQ